MSKKKRYHEPGDRNGPCYCGSGRKYKKCCLPKDEGFIINPEGHLEKVASYTTPAKLAVDNSH